MDHEELLTRGVANIISNKTELKNLLKSGKKLNIYLGIDPTSTKIHLGHAVPLRLLNNFAKLGHNVTFLIGDFTSLIGDTSDKDTERPVLTSEQIEQNFQTYKKQAEKILDFSKVKVKYNSTWLGKLTFKDIVALTQHFSVGDFVGRELIRKRLQENRRVGLHEFLYPVMQGYDSYHMDTDIQIGGTDQTFNMQAGRTLQKDFRQKDSFIMTNVIMEGTDGRKMSKSWGNAIWLDDSPEDMFAKVMAINDNLIESYFILATGMELPVAKKIISSLKRGENPMKVKKLLAVQIVTELHNEEAAAKAKEGFESQVQNKQMPENIDLKTFYAEELTITEIVMHGLNISSRSEAKRLIEQGGVSIDYEVVKEPTQMINIKGERLLKAGKRKYLKVRTK